MSYILDALRKADAQRESDPARGIHAQPAVAAAARTTSATPAWAWAGAALCGAAVVAYAAWPAAQPQRPAPAEPAALAPAPAPVVVPVATQVSPPAPPPLPTPVVARPAPQPEAPAAAAAPAPASAPEPARILAYADLPAAVRGELPKLAISGGVHSENAAQRMLIVGGQVVNEGAELAPGVVLEQIRPRTAVLRYKDYRYSVAY